MPDNKGWRKRKPPKELPSLDVGGEEIATPEEPNERRRHHGWRKTRTASRPHTPVSATSATPTIKDADDVVSERSEPTPRRDSKPKLARYTSLFSSFKEAIKGPEFAEPWSEEAPSFEPYVDPLNALQSVRSHMISTSSRPIPTEYNNGLFRIFDDYRRVREEKQRLDILMQEITRDWNKAEERWSESELRYETEIRRLDLLIAKGTSGMAGLMKARQGSVVDRRRRHGKSISNDKLFSTCEVLPSDQLDEEIKVRSLKALLQRSTSPSRKMIALSRQYTSNGTALPVGEPPMESKKMTLSRKVQSELSLTSLSRKDLAPREFITNSVVSGFSGSTGDPLPDEILAPLPEIVESPVECDAFVALRELGTLVARRRGLHVDSFLDSLMMLFTTTTYSGPMVESAKGKSSPAPPAMDSSTDVGGPIDQEVLTPTPTLGKNQSRPRVNPPQKHRRQFSFEMGDDYLLALEHGLVSRQAGGLESNATDSETLRSADHGRFTAQQPSLTSTPSSQTLSAEFSKPSKIPSPVQTLGRMRRENSMSSLRSTLGGPAENRRDSRSSTMTAFRENSTTNLRYSSTSRSNSSHECRAVGSSLPSKKPSLCLPDGDSTIAVVAAKVASNRAATRANDSPTRYNTTPSLQRFNSTRSPKMGNSVPN